MASFGVDGVDDRRRRRSSSRPGRYAADELHDRARRLLGELPAGDGGGGRRAGRGRRARAAIACRATPRFADLLGAMGCAVDDATTRHHRRARPGAPLRGIDVDMSDMSRPRADAGRRGRVADDADDDPRRGLHPRQGERPPRRPRAPSCAALGADVDETDDGLRIEPAGRCTARDSTPTTTTAWRWRSACSACASTASRSPIPTWCRRAGRGSGTMLGGLAVSDKMVVAAFDVDGTMTRATAFARSSSGSPVGDASSPRCCAAPLATVAAAVRAIATDSRRSSSAGSLARQARWPTSRRRASSSPQYVLVNWLRPDTLRRLRWHQRSGHRIVFVSASLAAYLRPMAQRLGIDDVLCTDSTAQR